MVIALHILCIIYLLASLFVWTQIVASPSRTASGFHVYIWYLLPVALAIVGLLA